MTRLFSSVKIAPGVRLTTTSRGLRAHVGPRAMRVHVGGGRTGVSTGAGPFTVYQSAGATRWPTTSAGTDRATQARAAAEDLRRLHDLHRAAVTAPHQEVAVRPELPKFLTLLGTAEKHELKGVPRLDRQARRTARTRARAVAERWALGLLAKAEAEVRAQQERIDSQRAGLLAGEPAAVSAGLQQVFAGWRVRAVGVAPRTATLVVAVLSPELLPLLKPGTTKAGAPTVVRLNKTELADNHRQAVAAGMLLAARQAFVAVPGLTSVRVVGADGSTALAAATLTREGFEHVDLRLPAWPILEQADPGLLAMTKGRARELQPLALTASAYAEAAPHLT
jgi:hypothetical protein